MLTPPPPQEAVVQYEQYEQEVRELQGLIEEAHQVIQDRPVPSSNIQELQAQILHHEVPPPPVCRRSADRLQTNRSLFDLQELAQKIKGYQEQIASLNSKCKMLAVKAKHATLLLTVSDEHGLPAELQDEGEVRKPTVTVRNPESVALDFL